MSMLDESPSSVAKEKYPKLVMSRMEFKCSEAVSGSICFVFHREQLVEVVYSSCFPGHVARSAHKNKLVLEFKRCMFVRLYAL